MKIVTSTEYCLYWVLSSSLCFSSLLYFFSSFQYVNAKEKQYKSDRHRNRERIALFSATINIRFADLWTLVNYYYRPQQSSRFYDLRFFERDRYQQEISIVEAKKLWLDLSSWIHFWQINFRPRIELNKLLALLAKSNVSSLFLNGFEIC